MWWERVGKGQHEYSLPLVFRQRLGASLEEIELRQKRREVDLYIYENDVDGLSGSLKDRVEIVEDLHETF